MTSRSDLCLYLLNLFGSSYPDVWENRATTASRHVLADGGIDRRRRADTVPFGSVSVPPDRSYISKIFILRGDSGMLSRGGQGVCPVLDRALGRCSGLRCNWWKKMNGQGTRLGVSFLSAEVLPFFLDFGFMSIFCLIFTGSILEVINLSDSASSGRSWFSVEDLLRFLAVVLEECFAMMLSLHCTDSLY